MLTRQKQDTKLVGFVPDKEKCLCVKAFLSQFSSGVRGACERAVAAHVVSAADEEALMHLSPERAMDGGVATPASDMWAFGVFLVHVCSFEAPYPDGGGGARGEAGASRTSAQLLEGIATKVMRPRVPEPSMLPHPDLAKLIDGCLAADPSKRWNAQRAVLLLNSIVVEEKHRRKMQNGKGGAFSTGGGVARGQDMLV